MILYKVKFAHLPATKKVKKKFLENISDIEDVTEFDALEILRMPFLSSEEKLLLVLRTDFFSKKLLYEIKITFSWDTLLLISEVDNSTVEAFEDLSWREGVDPRLVSALEKFKSLAREKVSKKDANELEAQVDSVLSEYDYIYTCVPSESDDKFYEASAADTVFFAVARDPNLGAFDIMVYQAWVMERVSPEVIRNDEDTYMKLMKIAHGRQVNMLIDFLEVRLGKKLVCRE
jgi:hypothetical protein